MIKILSTVSLGLGQWVVLKNNHKNIMDDETLDDDIQSEDEETDDEDLDGDDEDTDDTE